MLLHRRVRTASAAKETSRIAQVQPQPRAPGGQARPPAGHRPDAAAGRVDGGPVPVSPAAADPVRTPRIDARERAAFERDGFVVLDRLLSAEVCALLNQRLELVLRGEFDLGRPPDKVPRFKAEARCKAGKQPPPLGGPSKTTLQLINVHKADAAFRDVVCSPSLGRAVSRLGGWAGARVANDQVWAKPPGAAPLTFHRDSAYFDFVPSDVITVWLALDDMDDDVGPLQYVPGSHRWEDGRVGSAQQFFDKDRFALLHSAARREGLDPSAELGLVTVGVRMGGCGIHNGRLWHGKGYEQRAKTALKELREGEAEWTHRNYYVALRRSLAIETLASKKVLHRWENNPFLPLIPPQTLGDEEKMSDVSYY